MKKITILVLLLLVLGVFSNADAVRAYQINRISGYTASPFETDSTPLIASCGHIYNVLKRAKPHLHIFAVSRDIFTSYGSKSNICGRYAKLVTNNGKVYHGVVYDTMSRRYTKTVDVLVHRPHVNRAVLRAAVYREFDVSKTGKGILYIF